jgi:hypothetical protein
MPLEYVAFEHNIQWAHPTSKREFGIGEGVSSKRLANCTSFQMPTLLLLLSSKANTLSSAQKMQTGPT